MDVNTFPELRKLLPIDVEKCREYWNKKMNGYLMGSEINRDWKDCEEYLEFINDNNIPVTARTYILTAKIPFIIANFIIEEKAK